MRKGESVKDARGQRKEEKGGKGDKGTSKGGQNGAPVSSLDILQKHWAKLNHNI